MTWKNVSLLKYELLQDIFADDSLSALDKNIKLIAIITETPQLKVARYSLRYIGFLMRKLKFLEKLPEPVYRKFIRIKKKRFRVTKISDLSGGQYIDIMNFLKDEKEIDSNIHNILAVILKPLRFGLFQSKYDGQFHVKRAGFIFENMTIEQAYPLFVFFCSLSENLTSSMKDYLNSETLKMKKMSEQLEGATMQNATAGS